MKRSTALILAVVALLAVLSVGWLLAPRAVHAPPSTPSTAAEPGAPATPSAGDAPAPSDPDPAKRVATRVPRPAGLQPSRRVVPPPASRAQPPAQARSDGLVDRREERSPDAQQLLDDLKAGIELVSEDIEDCIDSWAEVSPDFSGQVELRFSLDADGLQEVWIEDYQDVPAGPLSCFSAAVYEVDWADISDDPVEVSFPFQVSTGDTGG